MAVKRIGICFNVTSLIQATLVPTSRSIPNAFDYIGGLLSQERIEGERNIDYRNRLFDVAVHPPGPTYSGNINGLARDFGFIRRKTILIDLKATSDGYNIAESPRVDILANRVVLYNQWSSPTSYTVDKEIYFYAKGSEGFYLQDLVDAINTSTCFSASIYSGIRTNMHSFLLVRGTSTKIVLSQLIRADYMTPFGVENITRGTLWFEEKDIFQTEVTTAPAAKGEYQVGYENGWVRSYSMPSGRGRCGYRYCDFPMKVDSTPIQVFSLHDENFVEELHRQETLDSGDEVNALPNSEGSEIYQQLFEETKVFWGE